MLKVHKICVHCGIRPGTRPRTLCYQCYSNPEILQQHPSTSKFAAHRLVHDHPEPDPRPPRKKGDAPHRCLWCMKWSCWQLLAMCKACKLWYIEHSQGMPEEKEPEDADATVEQSDPLRFYLQDGPYAPETSGGVG